MFDIVFWPVICLIGARLVSQIMIGPMGFFLPDNIISLSSNTACERGGKVQVVFDEFKLSRSPHR